MIRSSEAVRKTRETDISVAVRLDGSGERDISTGIPFFDHMLSLFAAHGFFDLTVRAKGDIEVDFHHTVEDVGIVLGETFLKAWGDKTGVRRFGHASTPMDETLAVVSADLSGRPFLVFNVPAVIQSPGAFDVYLSEEFFRGFVHSAKMTLHINVMYGKNEHHIIEAIFKSVGRALDQALSPDPRIKGALSTKGAL
ncbi:Imidazoleglycerol-phosphate dehydratase [Candidatus Desulfarcum epimagneticum]|uniref:Imidazoleglycerol-phosphate dehydratase n=1 Tax=uncultured Desulfobacteraceae bacterium TaxID=218296 RepID=A0A484HF50_9BACT|nr:Imidazoleglycerol-phosphate dehydratase [uncultured Desulfobacteraceae bacterium]